jgi:hypothetical protein
LVFAAPMTSALPAPSTPAPEDKKWPGLIVLAAMAFFVISVSLAVNLIRSNGFDPGSPGGTIPTVTTPVPVVTISPAAWRTSVANNTRYLTAPLAGIPDSIAHLRYNYGVTEDSDTLVDLTTELQSLGFNCTTFHDLAVNGAPSPALAADAANVAVACSELDSIDQADLHSSDNKWTPKLASNDAHWIKIFKERVVVLRNGATN